VEKNMETALKLVKLINGEDIITSEAVPVEAQHSKEPLVRLTKPTTLVRLQEGTGILAWPQFSDSSEVEIRASHIIAVTDIHNPSVVDIYNKFTSKIVTIEKPSLLV
jgi:hypothetical protein